MALKPGRRWLDWPADAANRKDRRYGDRRQEIVFIGQNMKETEIRKALDETLLSEEEFSSFLDVENKQQRSEPAAKKARLGGD